jgi:hypothetical protein
MSVTALSSTTKNDPNMTITSTGGTSSWPMLSRIAVGDRLEDQEGEQAEAGRRFA